MNEMQVRYFLFAQFVVLIVTAFLHLLGFWLYLYWVFWWYDVVLHALGGAWVALAALWFFTYIGKSQPSAVTLACVIVVGVLWEIFEVLIGIPRESNYVLDTSLDLLMDIVGALLTLFFLRRKVSPADAEA